MAFDMKGLGVYPIGDLLDIADFPLAEYLPVEQINEVFESLGYTDATIYREGNNLIFDVRLVWEGELALTLPGSDAIALVLGSAGEGLTTAHIQIILGQDFSLSLRGVTAELRVSPRILRNVATGAAAEIFVSRDLIFDEGGLTIANSSAGR